MVTTYHCAVSQRVCVHPPHQTHATDTHHVSAEYVAMYLSSSLQSRMILSNKIARTVAFFYAIIVHVLILVMLFKLASAVDCSRDMSSEWAQKYVYSHLPPTHSPPTQPPTHGSHDACSVCNPASHGDIKEYYTITSYCHTYLLSIKFQQC